MQYWKPEAADEFAGDMMPFWDGAKFHLFYLLDRNHHAEQGGLGGHQWAHASTSDLVHWEHHPLAVPLGAPGEADGHGICTGSIFEHDGVFHAFYATRLKAGGGAVSEVLCRAASRDLIHFDKFSGNPLFGAPPGYDPENFRDPFVFRHAESGLFHLLVTASRDGRGVLAHFTSANLNDWRLQDPFLTGGDGHAPECPELFLWNGWWYLVYSRNGQMEYSVSHDPLGPWQAAARGTIEPSTLRVPRTAAVAGGRRLAVGFLPWRQEDRDAGDYVYAGNAVFRELLQDADGTLRTRLVPEMMPATGLARVEGDFPVEPGTSPVTVRLADIPTDGVLSLRVVPTSGAGGFGLLLCADERLETGYRLSFLPQERRVILRSWPETGGDSRAVLSDIEGLDRPLDILVCLYGSVIDVCLNGRHTLVERGFDHRGTYLGFFAAGGSVRVEDLRVVPSV